MPDDDDDDDIFNSVVAMSFDKGSLLVWCCREMERDTYGMAQPAAPALLPQSRIDPELVQEAMIPRMA